MRKKLPDVTRLWDISEGQRYMGFVQRQIALFYADHDMKHERRTRVCEAYRRAS